MLPNLTRNKKKIINDPIYGFISIPNAFLYDLIEHPWFQRLRRIKQLGLTDYVYPGATHTRFHHAIGAMHLMGLAIEALRQRGHEITEEEATAAQAAILLHDIGHGPFSHALENSIVPDLHHEELSLLFMNELNVQLNGALDLTIQIFKGNYKKRFLHQLVSSQLDVDRLDYLNRDSFYSGVAEGTVGADRIIKMMEVVDDELVVEEKGIYSIEKFILARRLMYWQVYLHKTVLSAENLLVNTLKRAKQLTNEGVVVAATKSLSYFLNVEKMDFHNVDKIELLNNFSGLDDYDIFASAKNWMEHPDSILSELSHRLINRKLYKIKLDTHPFDEQVVQGYKDKLQLTHGAISDASYFVFTGEITNSAYKVGEEKINIILKNGNVIDVRQASDQFRLNVLTESTKKYFMCFPKELETL